MSLNPYVYTHSLIQKAEEESFKNIDSFLVMQKAAEACFNYIINNISPQKILVVCGPGNNGGDGILIAKKLRYNKKNVELYAPLGVGNSNDSKKALKLLNSNSISKINVNFKNYDLIIDCIFGVGLNRTINQEIQNIFQNINNSNAKIISIDMPSGVYTDTGLVDSIAIKADTTLTFHRLKPGHLLHPGKEYTGTIKLLDINLENLDNESKIYLNTSPTIKKLKNIDHKYSRGSSYIVAGNDLIGASKLAALASCQSALRVGAGLTKLFILKKNQDAYKQHILEEMIIPYESQKDLYTIINNTKITSLIFGCGINVNLENLKLLEFLLNQHINIVLDASVFSIIKKNIILFFKILSKRTATTIMTPHKGEFNRIFKTTQNKIQDCLNASKQTNSIILYKGNDTVIGTPDGRSYINYLTSPYLATAGSGDVLAGLIGGLLAQGYDGVEATRLGCYIHSQCGIRLGQGLLASDLIKEIPKVLKEISHSM